MKVQLICHSDHREKLIEELEEKGIEVSDKADYVFVEKHYNDQRFIFAKDQQKSISMIEFDQVLYFESFNKITEVISETGRFEVKEKLYELEQLLAHKNFLRINKSMIVNLYMVDKIIPWIGNKFVLDMKNGTQIDVTRTYYADFKKRIGL